MCADVSVAFYNKARTNIWRFFYSKMINFLYILVLLLFQLHCTFSQQPCRSFESATENLREIVIGACTIYQQNVNQPVFCTEGFRNCSEIWEAFLDAFAYQPKCNVSDERFDKFMQLTDHSIPRDKSLFWENVYPFVLRFANSGQRYFALSDTLPGYIGNGPQWCSDPNEPMGMSPPGTVCPSWGILPDCPQSAQRAFWIAASKNFGRRASGEIFILLNATFDPIFANDSYNALYELPYLQEKIVTRTTVLLINEKPTKGRTKCDDPSLDTIVFKLKERDIEYVCIENRRDVVEAFCFDYPTSEMCKILDEKISSSSSSLAPVSTSSVICFFIFIQCVKIYLGLGEAS